MAGMLLMGATALLIAIGLISWIKIDDWIEKKKSKSLTDKKA